MVGWLVLKSVHHKFTTLQFSFIVPPQEHNLGTPFLS